ncbi:MAG: M48 family metallopeptidase [Candidatus Omnitrophota bacterium]
MQIKIIRSHRRKRTISARLDKDVLLVRAPLGISQERLGKIIEDLKSRLTRKKLKEKLDQKQGLSQIATSLNKKYFGNSLKINSIAYTHNQNRQFGCCSTRDANIRISHRVGLMPKWVRNYVLVHEMAHLVVPNHSKAFWGIVSRYNLAERARGYLLACGQQMP